MKHVIAIQPREWFDPQIDRTVVEWHEGMTVGDLFPKANPENTVFKIDGRIVREGEVLEGGETVICVESPGDVVSVVVSAVIDIIVAAAVGAIVAKLIGEPDPPKPIGDESKPSESFSFGGTRTLYTGTGVPLPVVYGKRAVGGIVIGQIVLATGSPQPQQILNLLLALCSGPVDAIAGFTTDRDNITGAELPSSILINENPITEYEGVEMDVRLGTPDQLPIPGAPTTSLVSEIGLPLTNEHIDSGNPAVTDWSNAVTYTMPEEGDAVLLNFGFTGGLYKSGGASLEAEKVQFEVRYRVLDGGGTPTGDYFPGGSGDPELGIPFEVERALLSPFDESFYLQLYDPAAGAGGPLIPEGVFFQSNLTTSPVSYYLDNDGDTTWPDMGSTVDAFSVEIWVQPNGTTGVGSLDTASAIIFELTDEHPGAVLGNSAHGGDPDGSGAGVSSFKGLGVYDIPNGANKTIGFYWGDGSGVGEDVGWSRCEATDFVVDTPSSVLFPSDVIDDDADGFAGTIPKNEAVHVFITYERDFDGSGNNRGRIYINGTLQATTVSTIDMEWPAAVDLPNIGGSDRGPVTINAMQGGQAFGVYSGRRIFDRVVMYSETIESDAVFFKYAGNSVPNPATESVLAWWEMDSVDFLNTGSNVTLLDRSGNGHTMIVSETANTDVLPANFGANLGAINGAWVPTDWPGNGQAVPNVGNVAGLAQVAVPFSGTPLRARYAIEVQRVDLVEEDDDLADKAQLSTASIISTTEFSYPKVALVSLRIPAQDQLTTLRPNVSIPVRGLRVKIWDGVDEENPSFITAWTRNNSWIALDILTSDLTGLSRFHSLDRSPILSKFKAFADHCDEQVDSQTAAVPVTGSTTFVSIVTFNGETALRVTLFGAGPEFVTDGIWDIGDIVEWDGVPGAQQTAGWPNDGESFEIIGTEFSAPGVVSRWYFRWSKTTPVPSNTAFASSTVTWTRADRRSEADVVLDAENKSAWEAFTEVCHAGNAAPVRQGDRVGIAIQNIREPVQMFSEANILPGSLTLSSVSIDEEFNAVTYKFINRDKQFRSDSIPVDHSDLTDGTQIKRRQKALSSSVITRPSQIRRAGRYALNVNKLTRLWCEFEALAEAVAVEPGDVFMLSGLRPAFGYAGRLPDGASGTTFEIDRDIILQTGESYKAAIELQDGTIYVGNVTTAAGAYSSGATITVDATISASGPSALQDAHWAVGVTDEVTREFQVVSIEMTDSLRFRIRGAEYRDEVYDETGFPDLPTESGTELYDPSEASMPPMMMSLSVEEAAGPSGFGTSGSSGVIVSVQRAPTSNLSAGAGDVVVTGRAVSSGSGSPFTLGVIGAGSNVATFALPGGSWSPGDVVEISAAHRSPAGASQGPLRARKARLVLTGRGPTPGAPGALLARQTGSSALYRVPAPDSAARARPVRSEIRAGGWKLGQHVATLVPGEWSRPTDAWFSLPTSSHGRSSAKLVIRHEYANGQFSDYSVSSPSFTAPGTVLKEDNFEDGPWDSVTGDSGSVALSELESETQPGGDELLRFTDASTATTGTWTSPEWDLGTEQQVAVYFYTEGCQEHPITLAEIEVSSRSRGVLRDWSVEGPLSDYPDVQEEYRDSVEVTLEIAYSSTATPGTDWQEYRPGLYTGRSFAFRITIERPTTDYNVQIWRGAFRITEPARIVTYAGSF